MREKDIQITKEMQLAFLNQTYSQESIMTADAWGRYLYHPIIDYVGCSQCMCFDHNKQKDRYECLRAQAKCIYDNQGGKV